MLFEFFFLLRAAGIPATLTEFLVLLEALRAGVARPGIDDFHVLARAALVKDEQHFDRYDRVFGAFFKNASDLFDAVAGDVPLEWLARQAELQLSEQERRRIESLGGFDELMKTLKERLEEQSKRHQGGSKWIGTAGTSPFGAYGYNPEGVRIGQDASRQQRAVKVWDKREFKNLSGDGQLGTRNFQMALRRLRQFARQGAADVLDLPGTISATARNAGLLDLKLVAERRNAVRVLLVLDVGGSMDAHVRTVEQLFSAVHLEFKHLEYYYFHNFTYESMWRDNRRRHAERVATEDLLNSYGRDYKLIFVGDAAMSPYEIAYPGGSVEHWNEEPGAVWMQRLLGAFPKAVWLNPEPEGRWGYTPSVGMVSELMDGRMFPLTIDGLDLAMRELVGARGVPAPPPTHCPRP